MVVRPRTEVDAGVAERMAAHLALLPPAYRLDDGNVASGSAVPH
jgi:hypothetical protein